MPDLKGALQPAKTTHFATMTDPKAIGELLRAIDEYHGSFVTKCALQLAPLVFVRPGELRAAEWAEIDLDAAEWNIRAERMKMRAAHLVPFIKTSGGYFARNSSADWTWEIRVFQRTDQHSSNERKHT